MIRERKEHRGPFGGGGRKEKKKEKEFAKM